MMGNRVMFLSVTLMVTLMSVCVAQDSTPACPVYVRPACAVLYVHTTEATYPVFGGWGTATDTYSCAGVVTKCKRDIYKPKGNENHCDKEAIGGWNLVRTSRPCDPKIGTGKYYLMYHDKATGKTITCYRDCCCEQKPFKGGNKPPKILCTKELIAASFKGGLCDEFEEPPK